MRVFYLFRVHQPGQSLPGGLQGLVAEIDRRTVVGLQDEGADGHSRPLCLFILRMRRTLWSMRSSVSMPSSTAPMTASKA